MRRPPADLRRLQRLLRERLRVRGPAPRPPMPLAHTSIELAVAAMLDRDGVAYVSQYQLLPNLRVDFFVPGAGLVIECQGTWFHGDPVLLGDRVQTRGQRCKRAQDAALRRYLDRAGLRLVELWEEEIRDRPEWCAQWLRAHLGLAPWESVMAKEVRSWTSPEGVRLVVRHGDLTVEDADAIVNAANGHLAHGGGVAGAIVRRGGSVIQFESDAWVREHGPLSNGEVALTTAGALACRAVIHAVGPVWHGGQQGEPEDLRRAASNVLHLAHEQGFASVAMPAISSGIFGFPKPLCASILVEAAVAFAAANPTTPLREIRFTNFDEATVTVFADEFGRRFG